MVRFSPLTTALAVAALLAALAPDAQAGLGDRLKKKAQDKASQKVDQKADEKIDAAVDGEPEGRAAAGTNPAGDAAAPTSVSTVSTKFDYVPGDRVIFADDFANEELGEFPTRWKLVGGTFEVAEMDGEQWMRCVSTDGHVRMKLPDGSALPELWTLEFDFWGAEPMGSALTVRGLDAHGSAVWLATFPQGNDLAFRCGDLFSSTPLESGTVPGRHHVMLLARGGALKVYIDRQRMANVPDVTGPGTPEEIEFRLAASTGPMITNVRFAEGPKPAKDLLADGTLVTYGIHFDSGSDIVKPESAPVLRQIAAYLEANTAVKLRVVGHTDAAGTSAGNLDLSKRRAASVARVLAEEFRVAADRFTTDGKGDSEAVATNESAEGRAMNRRVEFHKA